MQAVGQAWLVLELTNSPFALATVTALQQGPVLFSSLFAGVVVDRLPKRRIMFVTQSLFLAQSSTLAVLTITHHIQLWQIYILAFTMGCINVFDNPSQQAFVMELVGREHIVNAVGLNSAQFNGARLLGPAIGGLLIARWDVGVCFSLNAISYVSALLALGLLRSREFQAVPPKRRREGVFTELGEGMRFIWNSPSSMVVVIVLAGIGTFGYNTGTVIPLLAEYSLHAGSRGYGFILGALGLGCMIAGLGIAFRSRSSPGLLLAAGCVFGVLLLSVAYVPWLPLAVAIFVMLGAAIQTLMASGNTLLQLAAPDQLRGRVMSVYTLLMFGSTPIGALFTGFWAERMGISATVALEAGLCIIAAGFGLLYSRSHDVSSARSEALAVSSA